MTGKADLALRQLSRFGNDLNQATDELSNNLSAIEGALNAYKLGVVSWVELPSEEVYQQDLGGRVTLKKYLGYGKHKGKWGLMFDSFLEGLEDDSGGIPLRDASREDRIAAIDKLPDLIEGLAQEAGKLIEKTTKTALQAKELAAALSKTAPSK
jgi:hypothetical protein